MIGRNRQYHELDRPSQFERNRRRLMSPDYRIRSIIVPVDGSALAEAAIPYAIAIAERANSTISFVLVHPEKYPPLLIDPATIYLRDLTRRHSERLGSSVSSIILNGPPARCLATHARDTGADLVVMTTHGRGGVRLAWFGSVAEELIRTLEVPVLIVRPESDGSVRTFDPTEILVPLDGSPLAETAFSPAAALARLWDSEMSLVQVVYPVATGNDPVLPLPAGYDAEYAGELRTGAQDYVSRMALELRGQGIRASGVALIGDVPVAESLAQLARPDRVGLLALATHGRGGLRRLVLGSIAAKLMRAAQVPVLVVPAVRARPPKEKRPAAATLAGRARTLGVAGALLATAVVGASCNRAGASRVGAARDAAERVYVGPGQHDEFYTFMSGGFDGQVGVYGLPSGRLLKHVPVFSQHPENGWGYSEQTKPMLATSYGFVPWDDAHHPQLSQTKGVPDGRWLFINGNNTPRIARLDLTRFETEEILEIPNSAGNHSSPFVTENNEYVVAGTRFSVPAPQRDVSIDQYKEAFSGVLSFVRVDPATGEMAIAFQVRLPAFDYDLAHAGKGPSHGWSFFTSYNSEQGNSKLEVTASQNDKDYVAAINWKRAEECVTSGKSETVPARYAHNLVGADGIARTTWGSSVKLLTPSGCPGLAFYLPTPKSPHGVDVDPTGEYIVAGGKLATVIPVHSFSKMQQAIADRAFSGEVSGIPVLKYEATLAGEVQNPGLGPLHTEFDGEGNAYTSMFISSEIVKWSLKSFKVLDRAPTYYSIGHLMIPGGDSRKPWGKYVLALNKITKDRYLPTGPELTQSAQLYDITGDRMQLLLDFPTIGEPHYAQALPAELIKDRQLKMYPLMGNKDPFAAKSEMATRVERRGNVVHVIMTSVRSHFMPDKIEGIRVGDSVYFHVTNLEQDWDVPHGFAITGANNAELLMMPGQTRTLTWVPQRVGVFPFYCTDFCSALHQEMQGYIRVSPKGSKVSLAWNSPSFKQKDQAGRGEAGEQEAEEHEDEEHEAGEHRGETGR
jgi:nitrous-oxide reductase